MPTIHTSIEISAPPSAVRAVFLDFDQMNHWHKSFFKFIEQYNSFPKSDRRPKNGIELRPGHKLHAIIGGGNMEFYPEVLANDEHEFKWRGKLWGIPGLFTGEHVFRFEDSKETQAGTTFVQSEEFSGVLSLISREGSKMYTETKAGFEGFNKDLKARCEKGETK